MNGRTENKIKTENHIINKINNSKYQLQGFYNYISMKYEHKTKELYINYIMHFLNYVNKNINKISSDDINIYLYNLSYKKDNNNNFTEMSGTYRATIHSALKLFFDYLYNNKIIKDNPIKSVPRPKVKQSDQIERIYFETKDLQKIINNINNDDSIWHDRNLLIMMTFLYTGMRCGALVEINIEDVDQFSNTISVIEKRNKKRVFKVDDEYISLYKKVIKNNIQLGYTGNALFISNRLGRMSSKSVSRMLTKYSKYFKKTVTPHSLRRSYGRNLYKATGDLYAVQNALGHSNIETTQLYVMENKTEAAEKGMNAMKKRIKF